MEVHLQYCCLKKDTMNLIMFADISCCAHKNDSEKIKTQLHLFKKIVDWLIKIKSEYKWLNLGSRESAPRNILCLFIILISLMHYILSEGLMPVSNYSYTRWYPSGSDNCMKTIIIMEEFTMLCEKILNSPSPTDVMNLHAHIKQSSWRKTKGWSNSFSTTNDRGATWKKAGETW